MERKNNSSLQVKQLDEKGEGLAVIATTGVIDKDDDVCVKGAFAPPDQVVPILPAHIWTEAPMGKARVFERDDEVMAELQMNLGTSLGKDWHSAMMWDLAHPPAKQEFSWGFNVLKFSFGEKDGRKVRFLESLKMLEVSPVLVGASVDTRLLRMKQDNSAEDSRLITIRKALVTYGKTEKKTQVQTTQEIAERAKIDQMVVYRILAGELKLTKNFVSAVSELLGISIDEAKLIEEQTKKAIPGHSTETQDGVWDGPANERRAKSGETASYYRRIFAWQDPDADAAAKSTWRFIHHFVDGDGNPGAASTRACTLGIGILNGARGGTTIPEADRRGVWNHLAHHLEDAGMSPPVLRSSDDISSKLADQLTWLVWDTEAMIERVKEVKDLRGKDGRSLAEDRFGQIESLNGLIKSLSNLIEQPVIDGKTFEAVQELHRLRGRMLGLGTEGNT